MSVLNNVQTKDPNQVNFIQQLNVGQKYNLHKLEKVMQHTAL